MIPVQSSAFLMRAGRYFRHFGIFTLLFAIGIYRFSLIDRGALSTPDEVRYWDAADAWEKLIAEHDIRGFFIAFASATNGRTEGTNKPGDTMLRLIPSLFQGIVWKFSGGIHTRDSGSDIITSGIHFRNPISLKIPTAFNVIISLLVLWVFYAITLMLFRNDYGIALTATLVYGLLANSNIYIRHILPYDSALLAFLFGAYFLIKDIVNNHGLVSFKVCMASGAFAGFGFSIYPGYYFFPVVIFAVILFKRRISFFSREELCHYAAFALSFLAILVFFELLARVGQTSYLAYLGKHAERINQGSFSEGFTFLPKYLFEVEGGIGVVILVATIWCILKWSILLLKGNLPFKSVFYLDVLPVLFFSMFMGFFYHATLSLAQRMVFYGRLLHMYYPFLIWATMAVVVELRSKSLKKLLAYGAFPLLSIFSFLHFALAYNQIAYPLDVLYKLGINTERIDPKNLIAESKPYLHFLSPPPINFKTEEPYKLENNFLLANFFSFYPLEKGDFKPFVPPANTKVVYQKPHFNTFPAYTFEAYSIPEREWAKQRRYQVSIYELV